MGKERLSEDELQGSPTFIEKKSVLKTYETTCFRSSSCSLS